MMRRFVSALLVAGIAAAVVALTGTAPVTTPAARASGAERLPATCVANIYRGTESLNVGVWTPEFPQYWDYTPPNGAWAWASGYATFTPSGVVNVSCVFDLGTYDDGSQSWPVGTFTARTGCSTARGGDGTGLAHGAKVYNGRATVNLNGNGEVTISCHLTYDYTQP